MGKRCMFTGHRRITKKDAVELPQKIDVLLESLIEEGYTDFCAGGAIGFDTIAALKVIDKKKKYGFIKLRLYLPCPEQANMWNGNLKKAYYYVLENADTVSYAADVYTNGCMQKRNRAMVDDSELCVAYCYASTGGTFYTLNYAEKKGKKVINMYEK